MNLHKLKAFADAAASLSKDPSTKVGAVVVNDDGVILSVGWNGFPRGVDDDPTRYADRPTKHALVSHAEQNAIAQAARTGHPLKGATIILSGLYPCSSCAKSIIQAGILRVISPPIRDDSRWVDENKWAELMFREANVTVEYTCN